MCQGFRRIKVEMMSISEFSNPRLPIFLTLLRRFKYYLLVSLNNQHITIHCDAENHATTSEVRK
jgi:hypothetical protein